MSLGDTLKRFTLADNFILNTLGNLVGIKNPNANGNDLRVDQMPSILAQSGVPVILPSSGTANASGAITHTTALPYQPSGVVGVYLPAGVVTGGSQGSGAGVYLATYSSTTVCQLAGSGITTTAGAYTQTTGADVTLVSANVPGGAMGINGALRVTSAWKIPNNANNKTTSIKFGATAPNTNIYTATPHGRMKADIVNRGALAQQVTQGETFSSTSALAFAQQYTTVDTSSAQALTLTGQLAVATDYLIVDAYLIELLPGLQ